MISAASIATRHGTFVAQFNHTGLCQLDFPGKAASPPTGAPKRWLEATAAALESLLLGQAPQNLPPMDLSTGTDFQQSVWRQLLKISAMADPTTWSRPWTRPREPCRP